MELATRKKLDLWGWIGLMVVGAVVLVMTGVDLPAGVWVGFLLGVIILRFLPDSLTMWYRSRGFGYLGSVLYVVLIGAALWFPMVWLEGLVGATIMNLAYWLLLFAILMIFFMMRPTKPPVTPAPISLHYLSGQGAAAPLAQPLLAQPQQPMSAVPLDVVPMQAVPAEAPSVEDQS